MLIVNTSMPFSGCCLRYVRSDIGSLASDTTNRTYRSVCSKTAMLALDNLELFNDFRVFLESKHTMLRLNKLVMQNTSLFASLSLLPVCCSVVL